MRRARRTRISALIAFVAVLSAFGAVGQSVRAQGPTFVSDTYVGNGEGRLHYGGHWERVRNARDGRLFGSSIRTSEAGAWIELTFLGRSIHVYGVRGPGGGRAMLFLDGRRLRPIDFYAPQKIVRAVVFGRLGLPARRHTIRFVAIGRRHGARGRGGYINLSGMAYE